MLDDVPVATWTFLASIVVVVVAYVSNDLSVKDALLAVGAIGGGSGLVGHARNGAGRGVRK